MENQYPIGLLLKKISRKMEQQLNQDLNCYGLTAVQLQALLTLNNAPEQTLTMKQLEKELHSAQSTTLGLINRLEQKGYVTTYTDELDRRVKCVRITADGSDFCSLSEEGQKNAEEILHNVLSVEERDALNDYLMRIWKAI